MKKIIPILIIIVSFIYSNNIEDFSMINSTNSQIEFSFNLNGLEFIEREEYISINSNAKGETSEIGLPKLPQFSTLIAVLASFFAYYILVKIFLNNA
mgnify:CR=1 FL=1